MCRSDFGTEHSTYVVIVAWCIVRNWHTHTTIPTHRMETFATPSRMNHVQFHYFFFFVMYTMCSHIAGIIVMWWDCICIYYHEPHMHTHTHEHKMINNIKPESVPLTSLHYVSPHILNISRCSTNATSNWYCSISIIINIFFDALYMSIEHE